MSGELQAILAKKRRRRGFAPTQLDGCVLWLRSDLGLTGTGGSTPTWANQGSLGGGFTTTGSLGYTASNALFNGHPTVDGSGAGRLVSSLGAASWKFLHDGTGASIAAVWRTSVNGGWILDTCNGVAANVGITHRHLTSGGGYTVANAAGATWLVSLAAADALDTTYANLLRHATTKTPDGDYRRNGAFVESETYTGTPDPGNPSGTLNLLGRTGGANSLTGNLAEVIAYNRYISDSEATQLEDYLVARYGL